MTSDMENLQNAIFLDLVPENWTKRAYPSMSGLALWFTDLLARIKELEAWSTDFILPSAVWLAGFFNPQSFLTAIMQAMARRYAQFFRSASHIGRDGDNLVWCDVFVCVCMMTGTSGLWTAWVCSVTLPRRTVKTSARRLVRGRMCTGCTWRERAGTLRYSFFGWKMVLALHEN